MLSGSARTERIGRFVSRKVSIVKSWRPEADNVLEPRKLKTVCQLFSSNCFYGFCGQVFTSILDPEQRCFHSEMRRGESSKVDRLNSLEPAF